MRPLWFANTMIVSIEKCRSHTASHLRVLNQIDKKGVDLQNLLLPLTIPVFPVLKCLWYILSEEVVVDGVDYLYCLLLHSKKI